MPGLNRHDAAATARRAAALAGLLAAMAAWTAGCDLDYPEVVVANSVAEDFILRNPSFNGCRWNTTLNFGETTIPKRCLPGSDRVHFQKLDLGSYVADQAGGETESEEPMWFNYQTVTVHRVDEGAFRVIEIVADDMEQDFSIPGPFGH